MLQIVLVVMALSQSTTPGAPQDEISDALAHAEALYYAAQFNEAVALLKRIDSVLSTQPQRPNERVETKLQLALTSVGLNDVAKAKSYFMELYALDPDYTLDGQHFSPKVITVAADAKTEGMKAWCFQAQTNARTYLDSGQSRTFLDLIKSAGPKCPALAAIWPEAAETFYRAGVASYKRGEFSAAFSSFETALMLSPEHQFAREYLDLTQGRLQLGQDQLLAQWQRNFDANHFADSSADYREITSRSNTDNPKAIEYVTDEYRKALAVLVEHWNQICGSADAATMKALRGQISELLPDPSFGEDIRARMMACDERKEAESTAAPAPQPEKNSTEMVKPTNSCLEMQPQLVLARLKTRVDPVISNDLRTNLSRNNPNIVVRVKARISETGDVTVSAMPVGNPMLKSAISSAIVRWKFTPIRDDNGPRCVDTEIPFALKLVE